MKQLLLNVTLLMLSLSLASVAAAQSTKPESVVETPVAITVETDLEVGSKAGLDEADEKINKVTSKIRDLFGEALGNEIAIEIQGLTDEEKKEIVEAISDGRHFDGDNGNNGVSFGQAIIALTAITFSLGLPVIILLLVLISSYRKRRQKMDLIRSYLDSGKDVPEQVLSDFGSRVGANGSLYSGLTLTAVGLAICVAGLIIDMMGIAVIGLIPLFIGIARLLYWKLENKPA